MSTGGLAFKQIEVSSLRDKVIAALKDAFFSQQLKPGDLIVERQLARQMNVGSPAIREALITLQEQGFVRRVPNVGTYVTKFSAEEVRQLYTLRVELETLTFQWAKPRVTENDLLELERQVDRLVDAGERGDARDFIERDQEFHRRCWALSGNPFLATTLERLMIPVFVFVPLASGVRLTAFMAREHYNLVNALRNLQEPAFSIMVRNTITGFAFRWISAAGDGNKANG
jgi:DNA-binding GntR family transcriptional regulator